MKMDNTLSKFSQASPTKLSAQAKPRTFYKSSSSCAVDGPDPMGAPWNPFQTKQRLINWFEN